MEQSVEKRKVTRSSRTTGNKEEGRGEAEDYILELRQAVRQLDQLTLSVRIGLGNDHYLILLGGVLVKYCYASATKHLEDLLPARDYNVSSSS